MRYKTHSGDEKVFAFLDDVYVTCAPERVWEVHRILEEEIFAHTQIKMHYGKTQVWNRGGVTPRGVEALTRAAGGETRCIRLERRREVA